MGPYELQRNEVLYRAAQLSSQFGVDMAMVMNTPTGGAIKYASSGNTDAALRRLQDLPTAEALTKEQVLRHHESGVMPLPARQGCGQWDMLGRQGAWLQLVSPAGQTVQLPALRPPGFLDRSQCPVSPRSEAAYASLTHELDRLCDLATAAKRRRMGDAGGASVNVLPGGGGPGQANSGAAGGAAGQGDTATKASRFKALSVEVPHQTVVGARPAGQAAAGPQTLEREALMMGPESLVMPSPSGFLTSGPQSLGGMQFALDMLITSRGVGPSPRNQDLLVAGQLGRLGEGGGAGVSRGVSESGMGDLTDLATPNSSLAQLNGYMWSPHSSNAGGGKNPGGFTDDPEEGEPGQEVEGAQDLVVQGRGVSKATLQALDNKAESAQAAAGNADAAAVGAGPAEAADGAAAPQQPEENQEAARAAGAEEKGAAGTSAAAASAIDIPIDIL